EDVLEEEAADRDRVGRHARLEEAEELVAVELLPLLHPRVLRQLERGEELRLAAEERRAVRARRLEERRVLLGDRPERLDVDRAALRGRAVLQVALVVDDELRLLLRERGAPVAGPGLPEPLEPRVVEVGLDRAARERAR